MADHLTVIETIRQIAANRKFSDESTILEYLGNKITYRRAIEQNLRFDCAHFAGAIHAIFTGQLNRRIFIASGAIWDLKYKKKTKTFGTGPQDQWELFNLRILDDKLTDDLRKYSHCVSQWVIGPAEYSQDSIFYGFTEEGLKEMQLAEWTEFLITSVENDVQKYCARISASENLSAALTQQSLARCLWFLFSASPWAISDGEKLVQIAKNPAKPPSATAEDCKLIPSPGVNGRIEILKWLPSRMSEMLLSTHDAQHGAAKLPSATAEDCKLIPSPGVNGRTKMLEWLPPRMSEMSLSTHDARHDAVKKESETPKARARRLAQLKNAMFS